ncbi:MAG TPA: ATP-dependent Clp protease proteolytic subunit [bacterium]|nr:ATP-dependent Clp protease proteolytic subunit [bacterium]
MEQSRGFSVLDFFWIYVILTSLLPMMRQASLAQRRLVKLRQIETARKSRVISLIHRQESFALLGLPFFRYISIDDSEEVIRAIRLTDPDIPIDLIVHTPGGLVLASEQIARALEKHPSKVTVFVPHYAMSGGTLIALAADEIVMDAHALLGPLDPQLGEYPAGSLLQVIQQKKVEDIDDRTLILIDMAGKAKAQMEASVQRLLAKHLDPDRAREIAELLTRGQFTHDYGIGVEQARALGLPVNDRMPRMVFEYMELFPQARGRTPSVYYIPTPYDDGQGREGPRPARRAP